MCPFFLIVSTARNLKLNKTASKWLLACSRLSDSGQKAKEKSTRKSWRAGKGKGRAPAQALPSFLSFNFRVCAFSIQRTRRSRSMELAKCRSKHTVKHTTQTQVESILLRVFFRSYFVYFHTSSYKIQVQTNSHYGAWVGCGESGTGYTLFIMCLSPFSSHRHFPSQRVTP